jgi:RHH-type proline utilization regulon transcriptional repressor/proline dehydrogenase/delta 1-pyrroline-5-carboxylate dehydrogenase
MTTKLSQTVAEAPLFEAPYAPDDAQVVEASLPLARLPEEAQARAARHAKGLIEAIRADSGGWGGIEDFLREYELSTPEGMALMVLAEALLRIPDSATQDRLIEEKLGAGDWDHPDAGRHWLVQTANWGLGLSSRIVHAGEDTDGILAGLAKRIGVPAVRTATQQAMRFLGTQFILGQTIEDAIANAGREREKGYRFSYDMLGEGARTRPDAERYWQAYADAIAAIGKSAGDASLPGRPGISVKLSALHPRYEATHRDSVLRELVPKLLELARQAKTHNLNLTVDAEEAHRLELSLEVISAVCADPSLKGWEGYGLAIQAYQKRARDVVGWSIELARATRRLMVRLVKGAYWDTEVKRAQELGLADYPVFTRKATTDVCFLACARMLVEAAPDIYAQFATHNAATAATVLEIAGRTPFEFQRLHGMGEVLHERMREMFGTPCRIYAPVGGHRDLLAYLVRRMLENGANSSFISQVANEETPIKDLISQPGDVLKNVETVRHPLIPLPRDIFGPGRKNSEGVEFGNHADLSEISRAARSLDFPATEAASLLGGKTIGGAVSPVVSPVDGRTIVGTASHATPDAARDAVSCAAGAFTAWSGTPAEARAAILERCADLLEHRRDRVFALLTMEAGKTLGDCVAEVREAADFCRYYAVQARKHGTDQKLPGPTGELNLYALRGRGPFVCISPWNFPLAIFMGQVAAALAAGNTVVAKPAEQTCLVAHEAVRLLHEAGVPDEALSLVLGPGETVGATLVAHEAIAGVAFTGSTEVAQAINRQLAAKTGPIVPLIAETGGINAMIVDATALPEQITDDVIASAFRSAGQRCSALRLICVQDSVADRVVGMIADAAKLLVLGDPRDPSTDMGPVIDQDARAALETHVRQMEHEHRIVWAGEAPGGALDGGSFMAPHIIELERPADLTKEVFGPVLHVVRWKPLEFETLLDAIAASGYGLTLGIHSRIDAVTDHVIARLGVGNVYVNRNMIGAVVGSQPFGGSGLSGTGPKAGGPAYLQRFAQEQVVSINTTAVGGNTSLLTIDSDD